MVTALLVVFGSREHLRRFLVGIVVFFLNQGWSSAAHGFDTQRQEALRPTAIRLLRPTSILRLESAAPRQQLHQGSRLYGALYQRRLLNGFFVLSAYGF